MTLYIIESFVEDHFEDVLKLGYLTTSDALRGAKGYSQKNFRIVKCEVVYEQLNGKVWESDIV